MNRVILLLLFVLPNIFGCRRVSEEDYNLAAQDTCSCVEEKRKLVDEGTLNSNDNLFFALCTMDIEKKFHLDVQDKSFKSALGKYCPEMYKVYENVVDQAIQIQNEIPF